MLLDLHTDFLGGRWSGIPISFRIFHTLLWSTQSKAKWFKTTQMNELIVLEVRSPKSVWLGWSQGVRRAGSSRRFCGENLFPCLFHHVRNTTFFGSWPLPCTTPTSCFCHCISYYWLWSPYLPFIRPLVIISLDAFR